MTRPSLDDYEQAVAEGVALLIGYSDGITTRQMALLRRAWSDGTPADDFALTLAAEIAEMDKLYREAGI